MASRRSEILSYQRSSDPSNADEMPKMPHQPLLQKLIKCDVPDISLVSDVESDGNDLYARLDKKRSSHVLMQNQQLSYYPSIASNHKDFQNTENSLPALQTVCRDTKALLTRNNDVSSDSELNKRVSSHVLMQNQQCSCNPSSASDHKEFQTIENSLPALQTICKDTKISSTRNNDISNELHSELNKRIGSHVLMENQQCSCNPSIASGHKEFQTIENSLPALQTICKEAEASSTRNTLSAYREELLIKCLLAQSEQIQKLQEQVNWLLLKTTENLSLSGNERAIINPQYVPSITSNSNPAILEGHQERYLETANKQSDSVETAVCHEQTAVTKQSTSTMTSLTFNGNDKFVIHKKLTVVTDSSKFQKEVSAQCSYTTNGVASPGKTVATNNIISSAKKNEKPRKSTKCNCSKKNHVASGSSDIVVSPDEELIQSSPIRNGSPSIDPDKKDEPRMELQNMESKIEKYIPNYENILKNVNEMILENAPDHHTPPPVKKTTPKSSSRPKNKHAVVPKTAKSSSTERRKVESKRHTGQRNSSTTSSNTSIDSEQQTPERRKPQPQRTAPIRVKSMDAEEESSTASRYGLSSPNLSVATKQYLENYGLVQDKSSDSERIKSSRKTRTSLTKRYPR